MKINVLEDKKTKFVFEVEGENHTLNNLLTKQLWKDSHVKVSGYNISHPLVGVPKVTVETDGADPRKVLADAVKKMKKDCDDLLKSIGTELK